MFRISTRTVRYFKMNITIMESLFQFSKVYKKLTYLPLVFAFLINRLRELIQLFIMKKNGKRRQKNHEIVLFVSNTIYATS